MSCSRVPKQYKVDSNEQLTTENTWFIAIYLEIVSTIHLVKYSYNDEWQLTLAKICINL